MKMFKISLCFFILFVFASCGNQEFYNLLSFTDKYSEVSDSTVNISDFSYIESNNNQYTAVFGSNSNEVLLTLKSGFSDNIEEVDVSVIKEDGKVPTNEQTDLFRSVLINALMTFCSYDYSRANEILSIFGLNNNTTLLKEGELTLKKDNFYFVYYSTNLISQVKIYNTYLKRIEATEKPVSKPYFAEDFIIKEKGTP